jgi:hypothetical protein
MKIEDFNSILKKTAKHIRGSSFEEIFGENLDKKQQKEIEAIMEIKEKVYLPYLFDNDKNLLNK